MNAPAQTPPLLPALAPGGLGISHAVVGFVVSLVGVGLGVVVSALLAAPGGADLSYLGLPVQMFATFLVGALALRLLRLRTYRPSDLGLVVSQRAWPWTLGVACGVAFVVIATVGQWLLPSVAESGRQVSQQVGFGETPLRDVAFLLSLAVAAPLGEEMAYRALIFRGLHDWLARRGQAWVRRLAFVVPALVSSYLFAVAHGGEGQDRQIVFLLIFGLIVSFAYWWTGSFYIPVLAHSVTNAINAALLAVGGTGFTTPLMWVLVPLTPVISLGLLWLLARAFGPGADRSVAR